MKKCWVLCLALMLLLSGCRDTQDTVVMEHYGAFDTHIVITVQTEDAKAAQGMIDRAFDKFDALHKAFDIYHEYAGMNNLCTVNANAGVAPVAVDNDILELLALGLAAYEETGGRVNIAMGGVLAQWKQAINLGSLPEAEALAAAAEHCDLAQVVIDEQAGTVYLADPAMGLDVGAVAKGWAAQQVADQMVAEGAEAFVISAGGNVVARGSRADGAPWRVGVQSPSEAGQVAAVLGLSDLAAVTSGDYQRFAEIGGVRYHHIIDPHTLWPSRYASAVTVVHPDSAVADMLSTACFLMPPAEAVALAERYSAGIMIIDDQGAWQTNALMDAVMEEKR